MKGNKNSIIITKNMLETYYKNKSLSLSIQIKKRLKIILRESNFDLQKQKVYILNKLNHGIKYYDGKINKSTRFMFGGERIKAKTINPSHITGGDKKRGKKRKKE